MSEGISANIEGIIRELDIRDFMSALNELLVNAFQAVEERFTIETSSRGAIQIEIVRQNEHKEGMLNPIKSVKITDNGIGFTDVNYKSFKTAYSSKKAELGGKGIGRFAALAVFNELAVESIYLDKKGEKRKRQFVIRREKQGEIEEYQDDEYIGEKIEGTQIVLTNLGDVFKEYTASYTAVNVVEALVQHVLLYYVRGNMPSVVLKDIDGEIKFEDYCPLVSLNEKIYKDKIKGADFKAIAVPKSKGKYHSVFLCAHNRVVLKKRVTTYYPLFDSPVMDEEHETYIDLYVVSSYLDSIVNLPRTNLKLSSRESQNEDSLLQVESGGICEEDVAEFVVCALDSLYKGHVAEWTRRREENVKCFQASDEGIEFRNIELNSSVLKKLRGAADVKEIRSVLLQEKYKLKEELEVKKSRLQDALYSDSEEYQNLLNEVVSQVVSTSKNELETYVAHRKVIITLMEKCLRWIDSQSDKYVAEKKLHNIIYAMGATQKDINYDEHNLWILDDRLAFYQYIASDRKISNHEPLNHGSDSAKEPDITLYNMPHLYDRMFIYGEKGPYHEIQSVVIFELKRPNRNIDYLEYFKQSDEQIKGIRKGLYKGDSGENIPALPRVPVFHYYICDENAYSSLKEDLLGTHQYTETPYNSIAWADTFTHKEIMTYNTMLINARRRNKIFFIKSGLE